MEMILDTVLQCGIFNVEVAPTFRVSGSSVLLQSYLRHRFSSGLRHAELLERFLCTHSILDGPPHQILLLHLLQSPAVASSSAARGITHTPSRSPKTTSSGITLTPPISSGTRKSMTFPRGA